MTHVTEATARILNKIALENNVAIVPGASALTDPNEVTSAFRLNYSMASDEQIKEGIEILGKVLYNEEDKERILSGIQSSGFLTLGNYIGALKTGERCRTTTTATTV